MTYEELLLEADNQELIVKEKRIPGYGGRICKNRIAINKGINTTTEKACILAEELGHYYTSTGNILDLSIVQNRKQERLARLWAYSKQIGLRGLIKAYEQGCKNKYEIAEYLEVTESFLQEAVNCYHEKYGSFTKIDNYVIYFEPLGILSFKEIA